MYLAVTNAPIVGATPLGNKSKSCHPNGLLCHEMHFMKTKEKSPAKLLLVLVFFIPLSTQSQTVFGAPDCGEWVAQASNSKKGWLLGYMSGLNVMHDVQNLKPESPLGKLNSADQSFLWMDNYCKTNPLKTVVDGGWELFKELRKK